VSDVAVVGAGLTGLVAAYRLAKAGVRVTVFERYPKPGGLVASTSVGGEPIECFYHHIFTTDSEYLALAAELDLAAAVRWLPSRMGFYTADRLWDFGTPASLLRFRPLPWGGKLRFALTTLYLSRFGSLPRLEQVTAREWMLRHAGRAVYDTIWGPLLAQKFAARAATVSMAWLWNKVHLRGRSRGQAGMGERLGYMDGSFARLVDELVRRVVGAGVALEVASPVRSIRPVDGGLEVATRSAAARFARVLFTAAPAELARVAGDHLPPAYLGQLHAVEHAHAVCGFLELERPLSRYYWLNVADPSFPFGGVIEHTNLVAAQRYGGRSIVYLSKYVLDDDPLWRATSDEVWTAFLPALRRINPQFEEGWIAGRSVFRAAFAQPIVPCRYSQSMPPFRTPLGGLYHACMAQVYPEDRGQNYAVRAANRAAAELLKEV